MINRQLSSEDQHELLQKLKTRFNNNINRHPNLEWSKIETKLKESLNKLWSLGEMERTGGEPDAIGKDQKTGEYLFYDCSPESPIGRRNTCYDQKAQASRKKHAPQNNAQEMAQSMGIEILSEEEYRHLQTLGEFDTKTSSWIKTPAEIRNLGGALYADRRYDQVFIYHNGADSYYSSRGFRGLLRV